MFQNNHFTQTLKQKPGGQEYLPKIFESSRVDKVIEVFASCFEEPREWSNFGGMRTDWCERV